MEPSASAQARHPIALWGVIGFTIVLGQAIWRLYPLAMAPVEAGQLTGGQWALYGLSIVFNGYSEGYRAFQLQVAPRVVGRAMHLAANPRPLLVLLAPLYCTGLIYATRKRLIITWSIYGGIVLLIILVRQLDQPWRGMVDAGVVVGLSWGVLAILWQWIAALRGSPPTGPLDLPASALSQQAEQ